MEKNLHSVSNNEAVRFNLNKLLEEINHQNNDSEQEDFLEKFSLKKTLK